MYEIKLEAKLFKALSEPMRIRIIELLSCREMCACELLEGLSISQSTLSHHMKMLLNCNLVKGRKDATWMYYSINREAVERLHSFIDYITEPNEECNILPSESGCKS